MPLTLSYVEERDGPHHVIRTQGKEEEGTPRSTDPRAFTKLKIDGKSKWAPGGRGVRTREVGVLLISGPGPGPGQCNSW